MKKSVLLATLLVFFSAEAFTATGNPMEPDEDGWRFTLAFPMLWAPDVDGKIRGGERRDFTIEFEDILEGLDFGLMGELYATRGPFGLALRFNYLDLKAEEASSGTILDTDIRHHGEGPIHMAPCTVAAYHGAIHRKLDITQQSLSIHDGGVPRDLIRAFYAHLDLLGTAACRTEQTQDQHRSTDKKTGGNRVAHVGNNAEKSRSVCDSDCQQRVAQIRPERTRECPSNLDTFHPVDEQEVHM